MCKKRLQKVAALVQTLATIISHLIEHPCNTGDGSDDKTIFSDNKNVFKSMFFQSKCGVVIVYVALFIMLQ